MNDLTHYDRELLTELRAVVSARAEADTGAAPARPPRHRRRLALAAAGLVAVAGAAAGSIALNAGGTPAYAVERLPDGSVKMTLNDVHHLGGLSAKMGAVGVPIKVVPVTDDCPTTPHIEPGPPGSTTTFSIDSPGMGSRAWSVTLESGTLPPGATMLLGFAGSQGIPTVAFTDHADQISCLLTVS